MKTKLPKKIETKDQAIALIQDLCRNAEDYHPEDDARDIIYYCARGIRLEEGERRVFTDKEAKKLNKLMDQIYALGTIDPCALMLNIYDKRDLLIDMAEAFFQSLIDKYNTYFLSDRIHEIDADLEMIKFYEETRDKLKTDLADVGVNIYEISQKVAERFLKKTEVTK